MLTQSELFVNVDSNASIVLNCTYVTQKGEDISYIQWKKRNGSEYNVLAHFETDKRAVLSKYGEYLKNRSHLVNPENESTSAILNINDVRCEDGGLYQCYVWYIPQNTAPTVLTQETDVILEGKELQTQNYKIQNYLMIISVSRTVICEKRFKCFSWLYILRQVTIKYTSNECNPFNKKENVVSISSRLNKTSRHFSFICQ